MLVCLWFTCDWKQRIWDKEIQETHDVKLWDDWSRNAILYFRNGKSPHLNKFNSTPKKVCWWNNIFFLRYKNVLMKQHLLK